MFSLTSRNYLPVSKEDHYQKMQVFIDSCRGLPKTKYEYKHTISDGVYIRQMMIRKGTLIVGAVHKKETALMMISGSIKVFSEDGLHILKPPMIKVSKPGTQRAGLALEDTILATIHRVDTTNLEEIVSEFIDGDISELGGITDGDYKLYINGRKIVDEKIQHTSKNIAGNGHIQRLLFT